MRPSEQWVKLDNARPRCPVCRNVLPLVFEARLSLEARAVSTFLPADLRRPTAAPSSHAYHQTILHRQCRRVLEIRLCDPALAAAFRQAA